MTCCDCGCLISDADQAWPHQCEWCWRPLHQECSEPTQANDRGIYICVDCYNSPAWDEYETAAKETSDAAHIV